MSHIHRTGPVDPLTIPVKLSAGAKVNTINPGDLVGGESQTGVIQAVPATAWVWDTDLATTQTAFAAAFLGIASGKSDASTAQQADQRDINLLVTQNGDVEFDCAAAAYNVGDFIGPQKAAGNALLNKVGAVSTKAKAVAIVTQAAVAGSIRVRARLVNTVIKR